MKEALEEVIQFYKDKGIEVTTPIIIRKSNTQLHSEVQITMNRISNFIYEEELIDIKLRYEAIANFLNIHIPKDKLLTLAETQLNNAPDNIRQDELEAIIQYDDRLERRMEESNDANKLLKSIFSHEVWHLIETEAKTAYNMIEEGTATYAMHVHDNNLNELDNILNRKTLKNATELAYFYSAALVKKHMKGSTDLKEILNNELRKKINHDYRKKVIYFSKSILQQEMLGRPELFIEYINGLMDTDDPKNIPQDLEKSEIFNILNSKDKQYIIDLYTSLSKRIKLKSSTL